MGSTRFLPDTSLTAWLDELAEGRRLVAPVRKDGVVVFADYAPGARVEMARDAVTAPKDPVFPACEEILRFSRAKDPEDPAKTNLSVTETLPQGETVVFGARPCGARGFTVYDRVYDTDAVRDPCYAARRASTAFVTLACEEAGSACFCHWVGSGPADPRGSDVLLTPVKGGWVAEAVTEKGEALLGSPHLKDAAKYEGEARATREKALETLGHAPDVAPSRESLLAVFDDMDFWTRMSAKCVSCGACTYLCPTCYCFNITDESAGLEGRRIRTWDNCMSFQFTLEASGHNPRPTKAHRLKNRVGHKFSYYPGLHGGAVACCGCGRCIRSCPAGVDIREIVLAAIERAHGKTQEQAS